MEKIDRYIQATINTNGCNLACDYCYLKLQGNNSKGAKLNYSLDTMQQALDRNRWGTCFISITGDGETLLDNTVVELARRLLENGHFLNIVNNGTQTKNLRLMADTFPKEYVDKVMLTFSLHYLELKKRGLLDIYFENIRYMRKAGFSAYIHLVLADEYIEIMDEIKEVCLREVGVLPQVGIVRDEHDPDDRSLYSKYTKEEYFEYARSFDSAFFELQAALYEKGKITEYCYAGELAVLLNLSTGEAKQCMCNVDNLNVFDNPTDKLPFRAVGHKCASPWCFCATFQILGMIPGLELPTYRDIFAGSRSEWATETMKYALSDKLADKREATKCTNT